MRTPDEIREVGIMRFKELARPKYDKGQEEHGGLLDETVTVERLEEEILDLWFYAQSLRVKHSDEVKDAESSERGICDERVEEMEKEIATLKDEVSHWREIAKR